MHMEAFSAHSQETLDYLKEKYRNDILKANEEFVQFKIGISKKVPSVLHYELCEGKMQLHFEWGAWGGEWFGLRKYLYEQTKYFYDVSWDKWQDRDKTRAILNWKIDSLDSLDRAIGRMRSLFDDLMQMYFRTDRYEEKEAEEQKSLNWPKADLPHLEMDLQEDSNQPVSLYDLSLLEVFNLDLLIPPYQRTYCWDKKNVLRLLRDVFGAVGEYRLGSLILQRKSDKYEIIDGQQRLTTLAMLFHGMGVDGIGLLKQGFRSKESRDYIAYNKYLINTFLAGRTPLGTEEISKKMERLTFSVLVLNEGSLSLAYTFFSNQNSKGKPLSDYDLLKAHHLRFIGDEKEQNDKVVRWNEMQLDSQRKHEEKSYVQTLDKYLFRLRKWLFCEDWSEREPFRIKNEYEASESLPDVKVESVFSEKSPYFEAIRGGAYFFDYVDHFVEVYKQFTDTPVFKILHQGLYGESHWQYGELIESLLYAYYLKYGDTYLAEAAVLLARAVSIVRLNGRKANYERSLAEIGELRIAARIESSGTPAILFSHLERIISENREDVGGYKILQRYKGQLSRLLQKLSSLVTLNSVKILACYDEIS